MDAFKSITFFFSANPKCKGILSKKLSESASIDFLAEEGLSAGKEDDQCEHVIALRANRNRYHLPTLSDTKWLSGVDSISTSLSHYQVGEDCKSPSTDGSCTSPEAKRLNENQGSMSDLHKDMQEASAKHALAAIWETLVRIKANTSCLIHEQKTLQRGYEELCESLEFSQSKMEEMAKNNSAFQEQVKEMVKTNPALQRTMTQLETDLEKKSEENAKFEKKLGDIFMQHDDLEQYMQNFNFKIHGIPKKMIKILKILSLTWQY